MTLVQWIRDTADSHDGLAYSRVVLDGPRVSVETVRCDGSEDRQYVGRITEDGIWDEACKAAGVESQRLELHGDRVRVVLDYGGWTDEFELTGVTSPGAWLRVPADLFDQFEEIISEWEEENG